jgi:hypothetical protein
MKKSQNMPDWLSDMVLAQHFCIVFLRLVKKARQSPLLAKEECNKYDLTTAPLFAISSLSPICTVQY